MINSLPFFLWVKSGNISRKFLTFILKIFDKNFERLHQYVNTTRIMNAQRKFMETDKNITEICNETGFSNLTHFNRVFKAVTGMTPSGYRKTHQNLIGGYTL